MITFQNYKYERPDLHAVNQSIDQLLEQFEAATSAEAQIKLIDDINVVRKHLDTAMNLAYVRASINTNDAFFLKSATIWMHIVEKSFRLNPNSTMHLQIVNLKMHCVRLMVISCLILLNYS
ncbi:hypothetical protein CA207_21510 [Macrococcoides caseolyticum]|nr:hypothetical protein CA207_21510 [Macrococcus caseolyticus]